MGTRVYVVEADQGRVQVLILSKFFEQNQELCVCCFFWTVCLLILSKLGKCGRPKSLQ